MTMRGREWLLPRALHWLAKQDMPANQWELIVVDDCSDVPIAPFLTEIRDAGITVRSFRLEHSDGWRGITVGMLHAFAQAKAPIIAEMNNHLLLPKESVRILYETHVSEIARACYCEVDRAIEDIIQSESHRKGNGWDPLWVSLRGFTLTTEATMKMDGYPWKEDVASLWDIPETKDKWTQLWLPDGPEGKKFYGSHLCCSIAKDTFDAVQPWPPEGFKDYGTDDPAYAGARRRNRLIDLNVWPVPQMFGHLAHNNHIEDCMELWPSKLNKHGHTDQTAGFWDRGADRSDKPTLQEVVDYWTSGQRTTDWRVRDAWKWDNRSPDYYVERARRLLADGKTRLEDLC
jgi:hypothetical protein